MTSSDFQKIEAYLRSLEVYLLKRYYYYVNMAQQRMCKINKCQISSLPSEPININASILYEAITQMKIDIKFIFFRRGSLIGNLRISEGKIAGVIAYRLARSHIINICKTCNDCIEKKCITRLNFIIAIRIGFDYIHKKYHDIPYKLRQELGYTMKYRHVNQEMLGLVFDAFNNELFHSK